LALNRLLVTAAATQIGGSSLVAAESSRFATGRRIRSGKLDASPFVVATLVIQERDLCRPTLAAANLSALRSVVT